MRKRQIFHKMISCLMATVMVVSIAFPSNMQAASQKAPKLNVKKVTLQVGKKAKLKVKGVTKAQVKKHTFTSNKKKVAKVSAKGKVTAVSAGKAKITCKVRLKSGKKYSLSCKVTVKKSPSAVAESQNPTIVVPSGSTAPSATPGVPTGSAEPSATTEAPSVTTEPPAESDRPATPTATPATSVMPETTPVAEHLSQNGISTTDNGVMRTEMTAFQLVHNMGAGINLGNTMEACGAWISNSSVTNYETAWGAPVTTQEMITGMRKAGFKTIRIPVAWSNMMSEDGTYTINEQYFDRVETIMNYAFRERMYVIINIHFDSGWWARFGSTDATERDEAMKKYKTMWTQIANRYIEYSDYLIFESANEELGQRLNYTKDYAGSGYFSSAAQLYEMTNKINQTFVDIVRGTGGNNSTRHLLIAGYDTDIAKTCQSGYQMPEDTVANKLMVSVHYYSPAIYCLAEQEDNSWGYAANWGTEDEIAAMKTDLGSMKIHFANKGYPVVIGEYGVCDTKLSDGSYVRKANRDAFFRTLCEYAMSNGMCPVLWDTGHVYDRLQCKIDNSTDAALYLEMQEFAESNPVFVPSVGKTKLVWNGTVGNDTSWNPIAPVAGIDCDFILSGLGGCYGISGIDWSAYDSPVLTLHSETLNGSFEYTLATTANTSNPYWTYIESSQIKGTWTTSSDQEIDLSALGLTGSETVYFRLNGLDVEGNITLTVSNK